MKPTLFLLGPSDQEAQNAVSREAAGQGMSRVEFTLAGVLPIMPFISEDETLNANSKSAVIGFHQIQWARSPNLNLFNVVGDADSSPGMLQQVQSIVDTVQPSRCFNLPDNVARTARAQLPDTLAGIPGCIVPAVRDARPRDFAELQALCQAFDHWPLILRSRGEHGGKDMVRLEDVSELDEHRDLPWIYSDICLIQYVDFKGEDGLYQKNRIIVVDGVPLPRHALFSRHWMVNADSRGELMLEDMDLVRREEQFLSTEVRQYYPVFEAMYRRIDLDVFGVDFAIVNGDVLVFEANACMKFLDRKHRADNRFAYLDAHVDALKSAIKTMLTQA